MKLFTAVVVLFLAAVVSVGPGCHGYRAAVTLDSVARSVDRYGFANVSTPFLTGSNSVFDFDLNRSAADYYADALKPQGFVRASDSAAHVAHASLAVDIDAGLKALANMRAARSPAQMELAKKKAANASAGLKVAAKLDPALQENPLYTAIAGLLEAQSGAGGEATDSAGNAGERGADSTTEDGPSAEAPAGGESGDPPAAEGAAEAGAPPAAAGPAPAPPLALPSGSPFSSENLIGLSSVGSFTPLLGNPEGTPTLSAREAILIAAGDKLTQGLLNWITNPLANKQPEYDLFYCPMVVSVQPGWDTRKGFLADVTVTVDLARPKAGAAGKQGGPRQQAVYEYLSDNSPGGNPPIQVVGAYPLVDGQVLDLISSKRRLYSMAFALAMRGFGSQGQFFNEFARKLERDSATRSSLTTATAYTLGANAFGFRVEPQYFALKDPAALSAEAGARLQSRSFPALAVVLVHRGYMVGRRHDENARDASEAAGDRYDRLVFRSGVHWAPVQRDGMLDFVLGPERYSEVEGWRRAQALDRARELSNEVGGQYARAHLDSRVRALRSAAIDTQAVIRVSAEDPEAPIVVDQVLPTHGWLDARTVLTIYGRNFAGHVRNISVGGRDCTFQPVSDSCILALVPPFGDMDAAESPLSAAAAESTRIALLSAREVDRAIARAVAANPPFSAGLRPDSQSQPVEGWTTSEPDLSKFDDQARVIQALLDDAQARMKQGDDARKSISEYITATAWEAASTAAESARMYYQSALDLEGAVYEAQQLLEKRRQPKPTHEQDKTIGKLSARAALAFGRARAAETAVRALASTIEIARNKHTETQTLAQSGQWAEVAIAGTRKVEISVALPTSRPGTMQFARRDPDAAGPGRVPIAWVLFDKRVKSPAGEKPGPKSLATRFLFDTAAGAKAAEGMPTGVEFPDTTDPNKVLEMLAKILRQQGATNIVTDKGVRVGPNGGPIHVQEK